MEKTNKIIFAFLMIHNIYAQPDLVAPFTVDLISQEHLLWDSIEVVTYQINQGNADTDSWPFDWNLIVIGIDSLSPDFATYSMPANFFLPSGAVNTYVDTLIAFKGPFSVFTWCDPLNRSGEGGAEATNNVRSQAYNFYPEIIHDTVEIVIYDTVTVYDTITITERDTIIDLDTITLYDTITITDTITIHDTITSLEKRQSSIKPVYSEIYNLKGVVEWNGMLPPEGYPPVALRPGMYLRIQGDKKKIFKVRYR